jgi:hypothetical protein
VKFAPHLTVCGIPDHLAVLDASDQPLAMCRASGSHRTRRWRERDSNRWSPSSRDLSPTVPVANSSSTSPRQTQPRKAEPLTGSGPKRQCLPGVAAHSPFLRGGTASSNPSSSSAESGANLRRDPKSSANLLRSPSVKGVTASTVAGQPVKGRALADLMILVSQ